MSARLRPPAPWVYKMSETGIPNLRDFAILPYFGRNTLFPDLPPWATYSATTFMLFFGTIVLSTAWHWMDDWLQHHAEGADDWLWASYQLEIRTWLLGTKRIPTPEQNQELDKMCQAILMRADPGIEIPPPRTFISPPSFEEHVHLARLFSLAQKLDEAGEYGQAEQAWLEVAKHSERRLGAAHVATVVGLARCGQLRLHQGRFHDAYLPLLRVAHVAERATEVSAEVLLEALLQLAFVSLKLDEYEQAAAQARRGIDRLARLPSVGPGTRGTAHFLLAAALAQLQCYDEALLAVRAAERCLKQTEGPLVPSPSLGRAQVLHVALLLDMGHPSAAEELLRVQTELFSRPLPLTWRLVRELAVTLWARGQLLLALQVLNSALHAHPELVMLSADRVALLRQMQRYTEADWAFRALRRELGTVLRLRVLAQERDCSYEQVLRDQAEQQLAHHRLLRRRKLHALERKRKRWIERQRRKSEAGSNEDKVEGDDDEEEEEEEERDDDDADDGDDDGEDDEDKWDEAAEEEAEDTRVRVVYDPTMRRADPEWRNRRFIAEELHPLVRAWAVPNLYARRQRDELFLAVADGDADLALMLRVSRLRKRVLKEGRALVKMRDALKHESAEHPLKTLWRSLRPPPPPPPPRGTDDEEAALKWAAEQAAFESRVEALLEEVEGRAAKSPAEKLRQARAEARQYKEQSEAVWSDLLAHTRRLERALLDGLARQADSDPASALVAGLVASQHPSVSEALATVLRQLLDELVSRVLLRDPSVRDILRHALAMLAVDETYDTVKEQQQEQEEEEKEKDEEEEEEKKEEDAEEEDKDKREDEEEKKNKDNGKAEGNGDGNGDKELSEKELAAQAIGLVAGMVTQDMWDDDELVDYLCLVTDRIRDHQAKRRAETKRKQQERERQHELHRQQKSEAAVLADENVEHPADATIDKDQRSTAAAGETEEGAAGAKKDGGDDDADELAGKEAAEEEEEEEEDLPPQVVRDVVRVVTFVVEHLLEIKYLEDAARPNRTRPIIEVDSLLSHPVSLFKPGHGPTDTPDDAAVGDGTSEEEEEEDDESVTDEDELPRPTAKKIDSDEEEAERAERVAASDVEDEEELLARGVGPPEQLRAMPLAACQVAHVTRACVEQARFHLDLTLRFAPAPAGQRRLWLSLPATITVEIPKARMRMHHELDANAARRREVLLRSEPHSLPEARLVFVHVTFRGADGEPCAYLVQPIVT